jgi:hypothetical protein
VNQDSYIGTGTHADWFKKESDNNWFDFGLNVKLPFYDGLFLPTWNGFTIKFKPGLDFAGRLWYNQTFYRAMTRSNKDVGSVRDVYGTGSVGVRMYSQLIICWGHDWNLGAAGYWGMGVEATAQIGGTMYANTTINSSHSSGGTDTLSAGLDVAFQGEAKGSAWLGNTEQAKADDDMTESHKLKAGVIAEIVFVGTAGMAFSYTCNETDWCNDRWNNNMTHKLSVGTNARANGFVELRSQFRVGWVTFQYGHKIWKGNYTNNKLSAYDWNKNDTTSDWLL